MTGSSFEDLLGDIFGVGRRGPNNTSTMGRMTARQECDKLGHRYQVHGKKNPTKVMCSRCEVSWAIGSRTEPS